MSNEPGLSVTDAITGEPVAASASAGGLVLGTMTALNYFNAVAGVVTVLASLVLLFILITKGYYNIKLARAQLAELERCNIKRGLDPTSCDDA